MNSWLEFTMAILSNPQFNGNKNEKTKDNGWTLKLALKEHVASLTSNTIYLSSEFQSGLRPAFQFIFTQPVLLNGRAKQGRQQSSFGSHTLFM